MRTGCLRMMAIAVFIPRQNIMSLPVDHKFLDLLICTMLQRELTVFSALKTGVEMYMTLTT